jgi:CelD/BcsL family acetyltransferase involved in cellulose biosynthesis
MEILDPLTDPRWGDLVERAPAALVFHHPAWLSLVCGQYRYPVSAWALTGPGGGLAAGLPVALLRSRLTGTRLISLPFTETCPPLIDPAADVEPEEFASQLAAERTRRGLPLEVRAELPAGVGAAVSKTFVTHRLALDPDVAAVQGRFAKGQVRRGIAKALREGVSIERRTDAEGLRRFYRLHVATRRRHGLPTQSKRFILRFSELFDRGLGFVLLARQAGRDVASGVFLTAGGTLTYEFGASDPRFLGSRPNNLLLMDAIVWACETGHHTLDFGRTDPDNHGLRAFKCSWGAEESLLRYSHLGPGPGRDAMERGRSTLSLAIRRAPEPFGRLVGSALYRHLG